MVKPMTTMDTALGETPSRRSAGPSRRPIQSEMWNTSRKRCSSMTAQMMTYISASVFTC